jgi:sulfur carrier protein
MQMEIIVNGSKRTVPEDYTAAQLVESLALGERRIAMEVNEEIVPRSRYPQHRFAQGDRIEIVHAVGGG